MRKRSALLLCLALAVPSFAEAQISVGVSGGFSSASLSEDDFDRDLEPRRGFVIGGFASVPVSDRLSLRSGIHYVQKGAEKFNAAGFTFELDYLEVPVLVDLRLFEILGTEVSAFAGPSLAFEVGCALVDESGRNPDLFGFDPDPPVDLRPIDCDSRIFGDGGMETQRVSFGGVIGAATRVRTSRRFFVLLDGGFDLGLTTVDRGDDNGLKNRSWFFRAGVGWTPGG